ncbi:hypothetical protein C8R45DRAFT_231652 [Mycena sanguinolenta]|nr:hypothetical protein C8R45DRAFT_333397 [Mycena sanguinolenta]KAJ6516103.1 hypothetical protein C8R45DRAFT_231652 [Mycena sanguinolenta]
MTSALHSSFCIHRSLTATAHNHALYSSHSPGPILAVAKEERQIRRLKYLYRFFLVLWRCDPQEQPTRHSPTFLAFQNAVISKSPAADNSLLGSSPSLSLASRVDQLSLVLAGAVLSTPPCWPSSTRLRDTRQALDALVLRLNGLKGGYMHVFWVDKE